MTEESDSLIYLYAIVPSDAPWPPPDLIGIEDAPVAVVPIGGVAAVVSRVPAEIYSDAALNSRLEDLGWVGARGLAHERVLDWFAERGPLIPLSLFSLHRDAARLEGRVRADEADFARLLDRLRGRKEWGIKLWRREAEAREGIDRVSSSLQELGRQIEEAPEGKRFLLEKKRDAMRAEEIRTASKRIAHELFAALRGAADNGVTVPIPAVAAGGERVLLLDSAFLVPDERFTLFQQAVTEQSERLADSGFELEFTGPWPPYHFSDASDE